ncbi:MAG: pirin family protein [Crocinitomix sp.]|nr:pirin family protein [Crocinitomix sp.]
MTKTAIKNIKPLTLPWETQDPFIFCSYHYDEYPGGNENLGPNASLDGRAIGQDFASKDGWNMYHGTNVPGFPGHPHSGFETISIVTKGMVDHTDSLGGKGRFGNGDVQWLTSGKGVQHAEMFPLLNEDKNPFEIFQLWLNLPKKNKKVDPYYKMMWNEDIPKIKSKDENGNLTEVDLIAGTLNEKVALNPNPDSWASDPENKLQIWTIKLNPNAKFSISGIDEDITRTLFYYEGDSIAINSTEVTQKKLVQLNSKEDIQIQNSSKTSYLLFLQGKPMNEPLVQHGPFVANSKEGINEIMQEYRKTHFGGWPYDSNEPVHDKKLGRFATFVNGETVIK